MNLKIAGAAIVLAVSGVGAAAHAGAGYTLNPVNTPFTATGQGSVSGPSGSYSCNVSMTGNTGSPAGSITGATFSGAAGCENVMAIGLPWKFRPISLKKAQINHFDLKYAGLGRCGPNQVNATVSQGAIKIQDHVPSKEGICKIEVSLATSPSIWISAN